MCCRSGCADCVLLRTIDPVTGRLAQAHDDVCVEFSQLVASFTTLTHSQASEDIALDAFMAFEKQKKQQVSEVTQSTIA